MPWTESAIFRPWLADALAPTPGFLGKWGGPPNDLFKAALFNDTITPNKNVAAAASAYGAGVWLPAAGVSHANWPAVGRDVENTGGPTGFDPTGTVDSIVFGGDDTTGAGVLDLANVFGDLLYDDTLAAPVADQGAAFHYFGGAQSVTGGTFTIIWNPAGIMLVTV